AIEIFSVIVERDIAARVPALSLAFARATALRTSFGSLVDVSTINLYMLCCSLSICIPLSLDSPLSHVPRLICTDFLDPHGWIIKALPQNVRYLASIVASARDITLFTSLS